MSTTNTAYLEVPYPDVGTEDNTWGDVLNALFDLLDIAIAGYQALNVAGSSNYTMSTAESRYPATKLTGLLTGNIELRVPAKARLYWVDNATTGSFTVTVKTAAGSGATVTQGYKALFYCDGTNVVKMGELPTTMSTIGNTIAAAADGAAVRTAISALRKDASDTMTGDLTLVSTDAGAAAAPILVLDRDSASPAASDVIGLIRFTGEDSGGADEVFAEIESVIVDPTASSEDGKIVFRTVIAGTLADRVHIGGGIWGNGATGGDPGAGKANFTEVQVNGSALAAATAASQATMEAGSSTSEFVTPGRQHFHPSAAKIWGMLSMSGGTPSNTTSYNITSITDTGVGLVTVTIANDFSSGDYSVVFGMRASAATSSGSVTAHMKHDSSPAAGSFVVQIVEEDGNETDTWSEMYFAGFGDI